MGLPIFWGEPGKKFSSVFSYRDASASVDLAKMLWQVPGNILMATGIVIDVMDVDDPSLIDLLAKSGFEPHVKSPRGYHFYFLSDTTQVNHSLRNFPHPKVDYLSWHWHVPLPPSENQNGSYQWMRKLDLATLQHINDTGIPQAARKAKRPYLGKVKPALVNSWSKPLKDESAQLQIDRIVSRVHNEGQGNRNGILYWAGCVLAEKLLTGEFSLDHYERACQALNEATANNGYEQEHKDTSRVLRNAYSRICRDMGVASGL